MGVSVVSTGKASPAYTALVRFLSSVDLLVALQLVGSAKALVTCVAEVRLLKSCLVESSFYNLVVIGTTQLWVYRECSFDKIRYIAAIVMILLVNPLTNCLFSHAI